MESQEILTEGKALKERRLRRACEHVNRLWFPVNPDLLSKVREGIRSGAYQLDMSFLLEDLKTDFALYTHCLRELSEQFKQHSPDSHLKMKPSELFKWGGLQRISTVVNDPRLDSNVHQLSAMSDDQRHRLQEALLSASAAETLSESQNIDSELGFSVGLLRQLGLTLIAWNYPQVYEKVASEIKEGDDLEVIFSQSLGFSPSLLAVTMIGEWVLKPEITQALHNGSEGPEFASTTESDFDRLTGQLRMICEVGEALARANNPERYPEAEKDWKMARDEIVAMVGEQGIKLIQQNVKKNAENYLAFDKKSFKELQAINPTLRLREVRERKLKTSNPFIQNCGPRLKRMLENLYEDFKPGKIHVDKIHELVKDIMPAVGFNGGCVYIIDPTSGMLVPRIKIQQMLLQEYKPVTYSLSTLEASPVRNAFHAADPLVGTEYIPDTGTITYIAGVVGNKKKAGVLYLEVVDVNFYPNDTAIKQHFKALKQALADCLNLT